MYPDVEVFKVKEPAVHYGQLTPPTLVVSAYEKVEVKIPVVEIKDRESNQLITAIEILSPVNKRKPGLNKYREKRQRLHSDGVHLLEIDLIRRGTRPFVYKGLPPAHYFVMLLRAGTAKSEIWAMTIRDKLPVVPVPLKTPDKDVVLDLGKVFQEIYSDSEYALMVNYEVDPSLPTFDSYERGWINKIQVENKSS